MNTNKEKEASAPKEGIPEYRSKLSDPKKKEHALKARLSPTTMGRGPGPSKT